VRWWIRAFPSTTPARSVVPPRSTPITDPPFIARRYSAMSDSPQRSARPSEPPPAYTKYRARPRLFDRGGDALARFRRDGDGPPGAPPTRRRPITWRRALKWLAVAIV